MSKPENTFIAAVHRHLPVSVYHEKMANPYRGGTADVWYDGRFRDLWVEYKFLVLPKRAGTTISLVAGKDPMLSVLQQKWLGDRAKNGRDVWVIVGCAAGGVIMRQPSEWLGDWRTDCFTANLLDRKGLARAIQEHVETR